ncbi:MAG: helix-turn-helix transcriptional regulator [Paludibacteraceae bacterium]|nr:helix-turn-helix transcriptional regulator [Paludibacteraceae bacterium]
MENLVLNRLKEFRSTENLSVNAFSIRIGMTQATVNNYFLGSRKLSFELIDKTLEAFPNLSAEWLLRGEGNMYHAQ